VGHNLPVASVCPFEEQCRDSASQSSHVIYKSMETKRKGNKATRKRSFRRHGYGYKENRGGTSPLLVATMILTNDKEWLGYLVMNAYFPVVTSTWSSIKCAIKDRQKIVYRW
ncbi:hypothetical protein CEXT_14071, partial [Caerostris extrusa]